MALRKLNNTGRLSAFPKSAGCSQKSSPKRPESGMTLQQTIEKLESLDFSLQNKTLSRKGSQTIHSQLIMLEKNLDLSEISKIGVTLSSQQQFKMYSNFLESLSKTISFKDEKSASMILRGLIGCRKAFNCLYTEIHSTTIERHMKINEILKKNVFVQTNFDDKVEEKPCSTPEYENLKQLPKALDSIQLNRISDQLSDLYDALKTIDTEIPSITAIEHLALPDRYKPLRTEEAKQVIISELKEIKENIENFIQKKKLNAIRIDKELQTDKEPKNATWVALEIMNEEKELNLLRLRSKFEIVNAEKKKLEEGLIKTSNLCSEYEKKASELDSERNDLSHKLQLSTEKTKSLERRVLELGAVLKKVITFKGFQKNLDMLASLKKNAEESEKLKQDQGPFVRRPSAYKKVLNANDFLDFEKDARKRQSLNLGNYSEEDSLKSFRHKVFNESERFGADGEASPGRKNLERMAEGNQRSFYKNSEGKYVRGEIVRMDTLSIAAQPSNHKAEKIEFGTSIEEDYHDFDLDEFIKNSLYSDEKEESDVLTDKQLSKLIGSNMKKGENISADKETNIKAKDLANSEEKNGSKLNKTQEKFKNLEEKPKNNKEKSNKNEEKSKKLTNFKTDKKNIKSTNISNPKHSKNHENSSKPKKFSVNLANNQNTYSSSDSFISESQLGSSSSSETNAKILKNPDLKIQIKIPIKKSHPSITINSSNPSPAQSRKNSQVKLKPVPNTRNLSHSYNSSVNSLLSNNTSSQQENNFSDKDSLYEEFPSTYLQIPTRHSVKIPRRNSISSRPLSRSSVYSHSKHQLDFSFTDNTQGLTETFCCQEELKKLQSELKDSFSDKQNEIFQEIKKKEEELKVKQALFSSKYVQCNLWDPEEFIDGFEKIRSKEKYRILLQTVLENNNDINLLGPKGRRELANSVKGHSLTKCSGTCEHLKKALRIVQKYRGKPYPLKLIKM